jgi:hypothetical protein
VSSCKGSVKKSCKGLNQTGNEKHKNNIYSKGALCIMRSSHHPGNVLGKKKRGRAGGRGKREAKIRTTDRWAPQAI